MLVLNSRNFRVLHPLHVKPDEFLGDLGDRAAPHQTTHPGEDIDNAALYGWRQPVPRSRSIGEASFPVSGLTAAPCKAQPSSVVKCLLNSPSPMSEFRR